MKFVNFLVVCRTVSRSARGGCMCQYIRCDLRSPAISFSFMECRGIRPELFIFLLQYVAQMGVGYITNGLGIRYLSIVARKSICLGFAPKISELFAYTKNHISNCFFRRAWFSYSKRLGDRCDPKLGSVARTRHGQCLYTW